MLFWKPLIIRNISCSFELLNKLQKFNYLIQTFFFFLSKANIYLLIYLFIWYFSMAVHHRYFCSLTVGLAITFCWNVVRASVPGHFFPLAVVPTPCPQPLLLFPIQSLGLCQPSAEPCVALDECIAWCWSWHVHPGVALRRKENSRGIDCGKQLQKTTAISIYLSFSPFIYAFPDIFDQAKHSISYCISICVTYHFMMRSSGLYLLYYISTTVVILCRCKNSFQT